MVREEREGKGLDVRMRQSSLNTSGLLDRVDSFVFIPHMRQVKSLNIIQ